MSIYRDSKIHHDRDRAYTVMSIGVDFCKISEAFEMQGFFPERSFYLYLHYTGILDVLRSHNQMYFTLVR